MRAGKRNDVFPNSYTGDPLAAWRRTTRTAGWPSWNMLYLDSGPEPVGYVNVEAGQEQVSHDALYTDPPKDPPDDEPEDEGPEDDEDDEVRSTTTRTTTRSTVRPTFKRPR